MFNKFKTVHLGHTQITNYQIRYISLMHPFKCVFSVCFLYYIIFLHSVQLIISKVDSTSSIARIVFPFSATSFSTFGNAFSSISIQNNIIAFCLVSNYKTLIGLISIFVCCLHNFNSTAYYLFSPNTGFKGSSGILHYHLFLLPQGQLIKIIRSKI